jgi:hypothetical protein
MRNSFLAVGVFAAIMMAFWISARPPRTSAADFQPSKAPVLNSLPAGTSVRIRLSESVSGGTKAGDELNGLVAEGVVLNSQVLVPNNARALIAVTGIHNHPGGEFADVTLELRELSSEHAHLRMRASPIKTTLKRASDLDVLARGIAGMAGVALGVADSASAGRNPGVGAAIGADKLTRETEIPQPEQNVLIFKTTEPIDLASITW